VPDKTPSFKVPNFNQPVDLEWDVATAQRPRAMQEVLNAVYGLAKYRVGHGLGVPNAVYGLMVGDEIGTMVNSGEIPRKWVPLLIRDLAAKEAAKYQKNDTSRSRSRAKREYSRALSHDVQGTLAARDALESQNTLLRKTRAKLGEQVDELREQIMRMLVNVPGGPPKPACELTRAEIYRWMQENETNVNAGEQNILIAKWHIARLDAEERGLPEPALPDIRVNQ
jgi:hypothetical protein